MLTLQQCFTILLCGWLGGYTQEGSEPRIGRLLTIEEVGEIMKSAHVYGSEALS